MSLILNIDTALERASVCLAKDGHALEVAINDNQKDHALWLHNAVDDLLKKTGNSVAQLEGVAVTIGPGSYTGLRVGLAAAKGLCYVLKIPLITINTLEVIAFAVKEEAAGLICPMIDARRMEVFTALYDKHLNEKQSPQAIIIDETSFVTILSANNILFCGNGHKKFQALCTNPHAFFSENVADASHLAQLSFPRFSSNTFADLAYTEPLYIKEFYSPERKD